MDWRLDASAEAVDASNHNRWRHIAAADLVSKFQTAQNVLFALLSVTVRLFRAKNEKIGNDPSCMFASNL